VNACREDTLAKPAFGEWIVKQIDHCFAFARELQLGIEQMEDIILVRVVIARDLGLILLSWEAGMVRRHYLKKGSSMVLTIAPTFSSQLSVL